MWKSFTGLGIRQQQQQGKTQAIAITDSASKKESNTRICIKNKFVYFNFTHFTDE